MCDLLGIGVGWSGAVLHVFDMKRAYEEALFRFLQTPSLDAAIDMQLYLPNHPCRWSFLISAACLS
jgi:hypothetical protein